jgi:hypothetical protein
MHRRGRRRWVRARTTAPATRRGESEAPKRPVLGAGRGLGLRRGRLPQSLLE